MPIHCPLIVSAGILARQQSSLAQRPRVCWPNRMLIADLESVGLKVSGVNGVAYLPECAQVQNPAALGFVWQRHLLSDHLVFNGLLGLMTPHSVDVTRLSSANFTEDAASDRVHSQMASRQFLRRLIID